MLEPCATSTRGVYKKVTDVANRIRSKVTMHISELRNDLCGMDAEERYYTGVLGGVLHL